MTKASKVLSTAGLDTIQWLKSAEKPGGGISAWQDTNGQFTAPAYPEVSGYLIPTLLAHDEANLARRLGAWASKRISSTGYALGLDGVARSFDTAAIVEGLAALGDEHNVVISRAMDWLATCYTQGTIAPAISPNIRELAIYCLRPAAVFTLCKIEGRPSLPFDEAWGFYKQFRNEPPRRSHYLAYALEGLVAMGRVVIAATESPSEYMFEKRLVDEIERLVTGARRKDAGGLMPFAIDGYKQGGGTDIPATAQFAALCFVVGLDGLGRELLEAVEKTKAPNGGIPQGIEDGRLVSWGAKYYLDALKRRVMFYDY